MKTTFRIAVLFCLGFSFCPAPRSLFSEEGEKETLIKSLIDARENWIRNASFCGHFTFREKRCSSEEEAMTAEISDGGVDVPARTRTVSGISYPRPTEADGDYWQASEWISVDLGERPPRKKDFEVKLKYGDFILHLKKPWRRRTIRVDKLTDKNYDPDVPDFVKDPQKYSAPKRSPREEGFGLRLGGAGAGLALIALALVLKYRKRRKSAARGS